MVFFEVKLVDVTTKEIYYIALDRVAVLPSEEVLKKHAGAMLIISTKTQGKHKQEEGDPGDQSESTG